ncbi:hypothetical protein LCGC14_1424240 [marine sediment metagenome]|uniref:Uncharacterized protein n=1 Tax=marine sediment metagenome TaxID=412755 RepID=A0A0F9KBJ1_9ZZZZ
MNLSYEFEKSVSGMGREKLLELRLELCVDYSLRQMGEFQCPCNPEGRCLNPVSHSATDGLLCIAIERELKR